MKLSLPRTLLIPLLACWATAAAETLTDLGNVMYVGDSITHGYSESPYRWQLHKILVDNGIAYEEKGVNTGNKGAAVLAGRQYGGVAFDDVHSSQSSARAWEISGRRTTDSPRFEASNIMNWLGQSTVKNNGVSYTGSVFTGADTPDVFTLLIGTNDLLSDSSGTPSNNSNIAATTTQLLADIGSIVGAMYTANNNAQVYVSSIPCYVKNVLGSGEDHTNVASYNAALKDWVDTYNATNRQGRTQLKLMNPNRGVLDVASDKKFWGVQNMFMGDKLHLSAQGDLLVAGNYARDMGLAGRTAGQERLAAGSFETQITAETCASASLNNVSIIDGNLDFSAEGESSVSLDWITAPEHGFTVDIAGLVVGDGETAGWNNTDLFSISLGNGSLSGQLDISEAYIKWGSTILFSEDMSTLFTTTNETTGLCEDLRVTYVSGNAVEGVGEGFYVWLGDMMIGEALGGTESTLNGVTLSYSGNGTVSLDSVSIDGSGAYAPTTSLGTNEAAAFKMTIAEPTPPATPQGNVTWPTTFTKTDVVNNVNAETGAVTNPTLYAMYDLVFAGTGFSASDTVGIEVAAGAATNVYATGYSRSCDLWVDVISGSASAWYGGLASGSAVHTGDITMRLSGTCTGGGTVFGIVNSGTIKGDMTVILDAENAVYGYFATTNASSVVGAYNGNIEGTFKAVVNAGTLNAMVMGGIHTGSKSIGQTRIYINGGILQGAVYGGGCGGSIGSLVRSTEPATLVTVTNGQIMGNVYGGGLNDTINGDTKVLITGGTIMGNIYGGGSGGTINGNTSVVIDGNLSSLTSVEISAGGSGGTITGNSTLTISNAAVSNYSGSIDKFRGKLSGGTNVGGNSNAVVRTGQSCRHQI